MSEPCHQKDLLDYLSKRQQQQNGDLNHLANTTAVTATNVEQIMKQINILQKQSSKSTEILNRQGGAWGLARWVIPVISSVLTGSLAAAIAVWLIA